MMADKELYPELALQMGNRRRDGGLRDVDAFGGESDAAGLAGSNEVFELTQSVSHRRPRRLCLRPRRAGSGVSGNAVPRCRRWIQGTGHIVVKLRLVDGP